MQGKLIVISAPSGSGKTTMVRNILASDLNLEFSVSACSRKPRGNEVDGKDYHFLSLDEFKKRIKNDDFVEWEEVYEGNFYGTLKSEVTRIWQKGNHVIFDVDVIGGLNIKKKYPDQCLAIFIKAPSFAVLESRLRGRSTDAEETIVKRLEKAEYELTFAPQFDLIITNEVLESAVEKTYAAIRDFIKSQ
jgi:guanylate kinase